MQKPRTSHSQVSSKPRLFRASARPTSSFSSKEKFRESLNIGKQHKADRSQLDWQSLFPIPPQILLILAALKLQSVCFLFFKKKEGGRSIKILQCYTKSDQHGLGIYTIQSLFSQMKGMNNQEWTKASHLSLKARHSGCNHMHLYLKVSST